MDFSNFAALRLLGQEADEFMQESYFEWMFRSLGPVYGLLLPAVGMLVFIGACVVVVKSRRPAVIASYLLFLPLPFLIGLFASLQGYVGGLSVIASSPTTPKPSELAAGQAAALFAVFFGMVLTIPSYLVLAFGLLVRAVTAGGKPSA